MSRDMQVGLLLAVGFLALVGGVLYYRIEHPDELEQYLNGGTEQTEAKNTDTPKHDTTPTTLAQNTPNNGLPPAPSSATPNLDPVFPPPATPSSSSTSGNKVLPAAALGAGAAVVLTGGSGSNPPATSTLPQPPSSTPVLDLSGVDKKPAATTTASEPKKPEAGSTSRTSLPSEPPGSTLPPPPSGAPTLDLNAGLPTPPAATPEVKKATEAVAKPEPASSGGLNLPGAAALALPGAAVAGIVMKDKEAPKSEPVNKSLEMPQPPVVTPPAPVGLTFDATKPPPAATPSSTPTLSPTPPVNTTPPLNSPVNTSPLNSPPPSTANGPQFNIPETVIKPNQPAVKETPAATPPDTDSYPPRAGLGKPMTESETQLREKRWAEGAGAPAPIIPSSADTRNTGTNATVGTLKERRVVRDTYIPTERAQRGETFSSLSQRLYGDTNYSLALAAYNKEEGFVKMDQPEANEWVAKPNREILDQRYPQLIRRLTPTTFNQKLPPQGNNVAENKPAAATSALTYKVAKGEQLFEVAKKTLGDGYRWSEIYALNKDQLRDSTELRPDMVLKLPADAKK